MTRYITQRVLSLLPVLLGVTLLVFLVMQLAPGRPGPDHAGPKSHGNFAGPTAPRAGSGSTSPHPIWPLASPGAARRLGTVHSA